MVVANARLLLLGLLLSAAAAATDSTGTCAEPAEGKPAAPAAGVQSEPAAPAAAAALGGKDGPGAPAAGAAPGSEGEGEGGGEGEGDGDGEGEEGQKQEEAQQQQQEEEEEEKEEEEEEARDDGGTHRPPLPLRASSTDPVEQLLLAAAAGDMLEVARMVRRGGILPSAPHARTGNSLLAEAARRGQLPLVRLLVDGESYAGTEQRGLPNPARPAINGRDAAGETVLHVAAGAGHAGVVGALLAAGADANARNIFGYTALHRAAQKGRTACVAALLGSGADAGIKTKAGGAAQTALALAVAAGHEGTAEALRSDGDLDIPVHMAAKDWDI